MEGLIITMVLAAIALIADCFLGTKIKPRRR